MPWWRAVGPARLHPKVVVTTGEVGPPPLPWFLRCSPGGSARRPVLRPCVTFVTAAGAAVGLDDGRRVRAGMSREGHGNVHSLHIFPPLS